MAYIGRIFKEFLLHHDALFFAALRAYALVNGGVRIAEEGAAVALIKGGSVIRLAYRNRVYAFNLVKEFAAFSSSVEGTPENGAVVYDYSRPEFHRIPGLNVDFFYTSLPEVLETNDIYLACLRLKEGDVVLDLGAYCGLAAYAFSLAVGEKGLVIAVEPDAANYQALLKNMENLEMDNVRALNGAVWTADTELTFNCEGSMGSAVSGCVDRAADTCSVRAYSLGAIIGKYRLGKIDAIKMDIEGSEYQLFTGIGPILEKYRPKLIMEVHRGPSGAVETGRFEKQLAGLGYRTTLVKQGAKEAFPLLYAEYPGWRYNRPRA